MSRSLILVLCAGFVLIAGVACLLVAAYLMLSAAVGTPYALMLTGSIGIVLALSMLWAADKR
ncbi:MAG: hypothetical protein ACU83N_12550 [Gammaproteobacteria bacterium]